MCCSDEKKCVCIKVAFACKLVLVEEEGAERHNTIHIQSKVDPEIYLYKLYNLFLFLMHVNKKKLNLLFR